MFGLIMAMTVFSATKLAAGEGEFSAWIVIYAALGCNIAWGIVDGTTYIFTDLLERSRFARFVSAMESVTDEKAIALVEEELEITILDGLDAEEKRRVSTELLKAMS